MGKGILSGMIWGTVIGGVATAFVSLYVPIPPKLETAETPEAETASIVTTTQDTGPTEAEEVTAAEPEQTTPAQAETAETAATAQTETPTATVATEEAAMTDVTEVAPVTQSETAAPVTQATESAATSTADQATDVPTEEAAKVAAETATTATTSTDNATAITGDVADKPAVTTTLSSTPEAPTVTGVELPTISSATDEAVVESSEPKRLTVTAREDTQPEKVESPSIVTRVEPPKQEDTEIETAAADTPIGVDAPEIESPTTGIITNRLPSVTAPSTDEETAEAVTTDEATETEPEDAAPESALAIDRYAAEVEVPEGASLFSIVLIDAGGDGIPRDRIAALELPISVAIVPTMDGAKDAMATYRAAGIEVVAMPDDLPVAASPSDVAVAMTGYFSILDQAIGVIDPLDGRIQSNRSLLQPVLGAIRDTGHGLLTYDRGLNSAQKAARRENIPAATVYRVLDADLEKAPLIKRYLDRAAFTANQDGSVVVVGRTYEDTITALVEWGLERKDGDLAFVPVSKVMKVDAN